MPHVGRKSDESRPISRIYLYGNFFMIWNDHVTEIQSGASSLKVLLYYYPNSDYKRNTYIKSLHRIKQIKTTN